MEDNREVEQRDINIYLQKSDIIIFPDIYFLVKNTYNDNNLKDFTKFNKFMLVYSYPSIKNSKAPHIIILINYLIIMDSVFTLRETDPGVVFIEFLSSISQLIYPFLNDFLSIRPTKNDKIE